MEKSKIIMVLPGTIWQLALVDKIKEMGHKVLVVNPTPNPLTFSHVDGYLQSDIFDKDKVIAYGKKNHVNAIMSDECDIAMNLIAELGREFGVPALDEYTARLYTDKFLMREFSKKLGLKYPEYRCCKVVEEAIELLHEVSGPIIIKPLDSNASHGVFKVSTEDELRKKFEESLSFSRYSKYVLAERFIKGVEFTIDGVKTPSTHYTLAISEKKHFQHNENIANELFFTHSNERFDYATLRHINDTFIMHSNLQFGFTHAEYKCEDGEFYLIEIAARGGGNMISSVITQYMTGYDTYRYLIECATGDIHDQDFSLRPEYSNRVAVLKFFSTPHEGGIVRDIVGLDYLNLEPDIIQYKLNFGIGDAIRQASNDSARIGFYIAGSESVERLKEVMSNVERRFKIIL
ncbi:ATP-grasp domain-containing protein [Bacteroides uniformis]|uniref:ATP-grasp domain-containing protein n=1 Tax=Bacteroides uniformis TaxID=820 RepID=UPI0039B690D9